MDSRCRKCAHYKFVLGKPVCYCMSRTIRHGMHGDICESYFEKERTITSITDELRKELTKLGIEWRNGLKDVTLVGNWCFVEYDNGKFTATCEPVLTPEQVIAVALGNLKSCGGTCESGCQS